MADDRNRFGRRVRPASRTDVRLTGLVAGRILGDPRLDHERLTIEVQNGVVTLFGTVSSLYARVTAADLARSTPGVRDICNRLELARAADVSTLAADPFDDLMRHWQDEHPAKRGLVATVLAALTGRVRKPPATPATPQ